MATGSSAWSAGAGGSRRQWAAGYATSTCRCSARAQRRRTHPSGWLGLAVAALVAGCGISGEVKDAAKARREHLEATRAQIEAIERDAQAAVQGPDASLFRGYGETWKRQLAESRSALDSAGALLDERVAPLLEADNSDDEAAVINLLRDARDEARRALAIAESIPAQIATFRRYRDTAPELVSRAQRAAKDAEGPVRAAQPAVEAAWGQYAEKKADLQRRWAAVAGEGGLLATSRAAAERAGAELAKGEPDYAVLGQSAELADSLATPVMSRALEELRGRVRQLGESYEKRLADMKIESRHAADLWVSRWDPWSDFEIEREEPYQTISIDEETFDKYDQWLDEGRNVVVEQGSNYEVFVNELSEEVHYYHKYEIIRGTGREVTDWVEVDQVTFKQHEEHLGMALLVKPEGFYEDETVRTPSPPGYGYVGNPRYGRWQRDPQGRSFWEFLGPYLLMREMLWGPRYMAYETDWRRWQSFRARGEPYYGQGDFGTAGTWTRRRYADTTFGQRGGFQDRPSVREGAARRSRGPGERGK